MSAPWRSTLPLAVLGTGAALPGDAITTEALVARITERFGFARPRRALAVAARMGITARHIVRDFDAAQEGPRPGDDNAALCARAVQAALAAARLGVADIRYLIGHGSTPDSLLPGGIAHVADALGYDGPHIELRQACTGFANALMIASGLIAADPETIVAIVGSETGSLYFDPASLDAESGQLVNFVQMGDGAGAVLLAGAPRGPARIDAAWFGTAGLGRAPGISLAPGARHFEHDFEAIRASGHELFDAGRDMAAALGHPIEQADRIIPHQVSGRIGAQMAAHFGVAEVKAFVNADRIGNTGSAAIWIALDALRCELAAGARVVALGAEASKFMYGGFAYRHG